jgi:hypothetical protein
LIVRRVLSIDFCTSGASLRGKESGIAAGVQNRRCRTLILQGIAKQVNICTRKDNVCATRIRGFFETRTRDKFMYKCKKYLEIKAIISVPLNTLLK